MLNIRSLANRGDTIVEVMIVLAVLGLAIGISYATANRSLLNARQAQENSVATELTQNQIENLRILAPSSNIDNPDPSSNIFLPTTPYCIKNPQASAPIITDVSACTFGPGNLYSVQVYNCDKVPHANTPCSGVSSPNTLAAQTTWPDVAGGSDDSVILTYKAHSQ